MKRDHSNVARLYYKGLISTDSLIFIDSQQQVHHFITVLRSKTGDLIRLFNAECGEYLGEIGSINKKKSIEIKVIKTLREAQAHADVRKVSIAFSIIKPHRLQFLLEKCTEIGAHDFVPLITERTVIKNINMDKFESYVVGAAEQSERLDVPGIKSSMTLQKLCEQYADHKILFCNEDENEHYIANIPIDGPVVIVVGPEGGFSSQEKAFLMSKNNVYSVSLGNNILRAETAAIFALSCMVSHK